jgi:tetratricopeptide (TPR) repeat protein
MSDALLWNEIGSIYQKMGLLNESIQAYRKAIELNPDSAQFNINLAHSYFQRKEFGRAISLYQKCIPLLKTAQEQAVAWNKIGDAYRAMKDLENAVAAYRKADELDMQPLGLSANARPDQEPDAIQADESPALTNSAAPAGGMGEKTGQSAFISVPGQPIPELEPDTPSARSPFPDPGSPDTVNIPNTAPRTSQDETALLQYQTGPFSALSPSTPGSNKGNSASPVANPSLEEALAKVNVYRKITEANPGNHRAWDTLGKLYKSIGRYQDAIEAYKHAVEIAPQNEHYYYYLGLLFAVEQQQENTIWAFENVLRINPEYTLAHSALAGIFNRLGLVAKANQHISAALPKMSSESAYNRACFYAICGDVELSIEFLRLALENNDTPLEWIKTDPDMQSVRSDERYRQLIQEFEDPSRHVSDGNYFSSEMDGANNQLLPLLNNSLAR